MKNFTYLMLLCAFTAKTFGQTYCTPSYPNSCSSDYINNFSFNTLSNPNSGCNGNASNYIYYNSTPTTSVQQGSANAISMKSGTTSFKQGFGVWIDYNQDGDFNDSNEFVYASPTYDTATFSGNVNIPLNANLGVTRLRVRCKYGAVISSNMSCASIPYGETEDYNITITAGTSQCFNPPYSGAAVSSDSVVCDTVTFSLSLNGYSTGTGQTLQWQSSPDNITWTNIAGANTVPYFATQTSASYYRCMVTCGTSVPSASVFVKYKQCYCMPTFTYSCSAVGDFINNFSFNTLSKLNSGCNGNPNNYILDTTVTTSVMQGNSYNLSVQSGSWAQGFSVWIDYNQDGDFFDSDEVIYASPIADTALFTALITIPANAVPGVTRLRVRCRFANILYPVQACYAVDLGETEDYNITITESNICTPVGGTAVSNQDSICAGGTFFLSLSGNSTGAGQTYQWQSSADNISFTNISGAIYDTLTASTNASAYYRCVLTCDVSVNSASVLVNIMTLNSGTATGTSASIGNKIEIYNLTGNIGNIQWQSSTDGITYTDIAGAFAASQKLKMPGSTANDTVYVRAKISGLGCSAVFSNAVMTFINCATPFGYASSSGDYIKKVTFNTINNISTYNSLGGNVQDFKGTPGGTTSVCKGMSYVMTVSTDSAYPEGKVAWIDFNNNGSYNDPGELVFGPTPSANGGATDTVLIPLNAISDTVKMRVLCLWNDTPNVAPCFAGPYSYGEIEEYSVIISHDSSADVTASGPLSLCQGGSVTLTAATGSSYSWSTGETTQNISVSTAGNYSVMVYNDGYCSTSDTVTVTVNTSPTANIGNDTMICLESDSAYIINAGNGFSSYLWSNGYAGQSLTVNNSGTYSVTVTDANGCTDRDTIIVLFQVCVGLNEISNEFYVSVFPNPGKGLFTVYANADSKQDDYQLRIYNVLGEAVYASSLNIQEPLNIDLRSEGSGIYFMQIIAGDKIAIQKIVIK